MQTEWWKFGNGKDRRQKPHEVTESSVSTDQARRVGRGSGEFGADGEEEGGETEEQDRAFEADGDGVEAVEFGAEGIIGRGCGDGDHLAAQERHAADDHVLRDDGEDDHESYAGDGQEKRFAGSFDGDGEDCGGEEKDDARDNSERVQSAQGEFDEDAGLVLISEDAKSGGGDGGAEIEDRADPGAKGEDLEEAEGVGHFGEWNPMPRIEWCLARFRLFSRRILNLGC